MVNALLIDLYIAVAVVAGGVGAAGVKDFAMRRATIEAQVVVSCPAPPPPIRRNLPARGNVPSTTGGRTW